MALPRFWIRRFGLVFSVALVGLLAIQALRGEIDFADSTLWSAITALVVASLNTWWAWRHGCRPR